MEEKLLCSHCRERVPYETFSKETTEVIKGIEVTYTENYGVCKICGHRIFVPEFEDDNMKRLDEAYWREAKKKRSEQ
jgi:DNA-directed RNA polymerase subunit RPC12/RpoP